MYCDRFFAFIFFLGALSCLPWLSDGRFQCRSSNSSQQRHASWTTSKRWSPRRRSLGSLSIGQILKRPCESSASCTHVDLTCDVTYLRSKVEDQTKDDGVHLDLAEDILKMLFRDDIESASCHLVCGDWCLRSDRGRQEGPVSGLGDDCTSPRRWTMTRFER